MDSSIPRGSSIRKTLLTLFSVTLLACGSSQFAFAKALELHLAFQPGMAFLPIMIMKHDHLVKKQAKAMGVGDLKITWSTFGNGVAMIDALLSDNLDFAPMGIPPLLTILDKTRGRIDVRGLGTISTIPQYLVTRDPKVKTIKDFTGTDRIALPAVAVSLQAIELEMAVSEVFGPKNFNKLNKLTVSMKHPDAMAALLSGSGGINSHFSNLPFQAEELQDPHVHKILSSFDVLGGPASNTAVAVTSRFHKAHPKIFEAYLAALDEAIHMIKTNKHAAAKVYVEEAAPKLNVESIAKMLSAPDVSYSSTPLRTMKFATFMYAHGLLKHKPKAWKDYFFPDVWDRNGS